MISVLEDTTTLNALDFEPRCEGASHAAGEFGHDPGSRAEYFVQVPCGIGLLMCAGWVQASMAWDYIACHPGCKSLHPIADVKRHHL